MTSLNRVATRFSGVGVFSPPEPKAHGELIVYQSSRRPHVCASVNIFKHEYL